MGLAIYLCILVLLILYSIFYLEMIAFHLMVLFLCLGVIEFVILYRLKRGVYAELNLHTVMVEKRKLFGKAEIELDIFVKNTNQFLPVGRGALVVTCTNNFTGEKIKKTLGFSVAAGEEKRVTLSIPIHSVGAVDVYVRKMKIYDTLGIFSTCLLKKENVGEVLVVPPLKEIFIEDNKFSNHAVMDSNRYSPYKKGDDVTEIFDVREYAEGDKLQQIHWKLSFKKQTLMIKEYGLPLAESIPVLVDFTEEKKDRDQKSVELLMQGIYSFSFALLSQELSQEFSWYDCESSQVRRETVEKEEDLFLVLQEMFSSRDIPTKDQWEEALQIWRSDTKLNEAVYLSMNDVSSEEMSDALRMTIHCVEIKE